MGFDIKNKVLPNGFNKRNVLIAIGIVGLIILSFLLYAGTNNTFGSNHNSDSENKKLDINDNDSSQAAINNIINVKATESTVVVPGINLSTNTNSLPIKVPAIQTVKVETEYDKQAMQVENQARMKKLQAQYQALDSKSSMLANSSKDSGSNSTNNADKGNTQKPSSNNNESATTNNNEKNSPYLDSELIKPKTPYLLQAGSIIPCVMISGINSDISGQVIAQVRENLYDSISGRYLLIPQGSKLLGSFSNQVSYGQKRLGVAWTRVIYPNGYSIDLKGIPGSDVSGFSGFYDQVDNHYWSIFGSSFVIGMITAGMQYSQNNTNPNVQVGGLGISTTPTVGQTVAGSLGQQMGQTAMMVTQKGLNVAPTLTIRQGYMFTIMLTADVALRPYTQN